MMKKRVLMPLLVASVLMGIVVIHSCTKNQDKNLKNISYKALYESMDEDCPQMRSEVADDRGTFECPYCHVLLHSGDSHWHYFGDPIPDFDVNEMMEMDRPGGVPHFWAVDACLDGLSYGTCYYSGVLHDDPAEIQDILDDPELNITDPVVANWLLLPRFHAHKIKYRGHVDAGVNNTWHTGGGVPGWPTPPVGEEP